MEAKELQVVEFEIKKLTPAKIECNIEEVEIYMTAVKEKYNGTSTRLAIIKDELIFNFIIYLMFDWQLYP